ncbi:DUF1822 family protein [Calothrix sp. 336/3]|uniref:DUF1822 family protein n=1 Tax=Calothrix sp. 336/3 TaxID=1337936 RepID=UPI0004E33F89|nr:DUF1822 family protein [Calothrix sp. 336/3]AKG20684.1 hypothetical protein IJ00_04625 [Calothrix sp. 336/3]
MHHLLLEIPPDGQNQAWEQSQTCSHSTSRYQAYINRLCWDAVFPWLQTDVTPQAKSMTSTTALPSFWELVNGFDITADGVRFILVPSENIDLEEFRVPQEWVDIPNWVGDYYLAVQVETDDNYVRVWGYSTHNQLKNLGKYDSSDRTYSLDADHLINDITILTLTPPETTRTPLSPLPQISIPQAHNLINRLGNPGIIHPRLEIPFPIWGGLVSHDGWRQNLYCQRTAQTEPFSVYEWLENGISRFAQQLGWQAVNLQLSTASARSTETIPHTTILSRQLTIAGQPYTLQLIPRREGDMVIWRFTLQHHAVGALIPGGFILRLLTEDLQDFENNQGIATTATEQLYVEVALEPAEGIIWEVTPLPENYQREILRF